MMFDQSGDSIDNTPSAAIGMARPSVNRGLGEIQVDTTEGAIHREVAEQALKRNPRGYAASDSVLAVFSRLVSETGLERYCGRIGLVRRQVNRMLSGAQPNPINRLLVAIQAAEPEEGERAMHYVCGQMGGRFEPTEKRSISVMPMEGARALQACSAAIEANESASSLPPDRIAAARAALDWLESRGR